MGQYLLMEILDQVKRILCLAQIFMTINLKE